MPDPMNVGQRPVVTRSNTGVDPLVDNGATTVNETPATTTLQQPDAPAHGLGAWIRGLKDKASHALENHYLTAHDGWAAVNKDGTVEIGAPPAGTEYAAPKLMKPLFALMNNLAHRDDGDTLHFSVGGEDVDGTDTKRHGEQEPAQSLAEGLAGVVDPDKGGIVPVAISSAQGADPTQARMLVLPKDYDGPIFVSDIDDTLRSTNPIDLAVGVRQSPIDGAKDILDGVASRNVPIVYLSAGAQRIHAENSDFLSQLPPGILLDNRDFGIANLDPLPSEQAQLQGTYKAGVMEMIQKTWPNAKIVGLGDDVFGDAQAYTKVGATAFIHDVALTHGNVPGNFSGQMSSTYTPEFRGKIMDALDGILANAQHLPKT